MAESKPTIAARDLIAGLCRSLRLIEAVDDAHRRPATPNRC